MYWNGHMSAAGWILSVVWTLIIIALVVAGIVWLLKALTKCEDAAAGSETSRASAREILDRRLTSGEINIEQYQQLRETIGDQVPAQPDGSPPRAVTAPG